MNKTELVAAIAEKTNLTKKDSEAALLAVVESITEALVKGDKVQVIGVELSAELLRQVGCRERYSVML